MCCRINAIKYPMYLFCKLLRPGGLCFVYRMDHKNWNRPTILRMKDRSIPRDGQFFHMSPRSLFLVELLQFYIHLILTQFQIQNNPSPDYRSKTLRLDNKIENKFNRDAATPYTLFLIHCNILQYVTSNYLSSRYSRQLAIRCNSDLRICNRHHWRSGHFCMQLPKLLWPTYMNRKCSFGTLLFFQPHEMPIGNQDFRKDHIYSYLRLDPTTFR